jgi:hypothetical protein
MSRGGRSVFATPLFGGTNGCFPGIEGLLSLVQGLARRGEAPKEVARALEAARSRAVRSRASALGAEKLATKVFLAYREGYLGTPGKTCKEGATTTRGAAFWKAHQADIEEVIRRLGGVEDRRQRGSQTSEEETP